MPDEHGHDEGYSGPATLLVDGEHLDVEVLLDSRHEPYDGRLHWSGRVRAHRRLTELLGGRSAEAELRTPGHSATGTISEPDLWGRFRIAGAGTPPFPLDAPPPPESD